MLRLLLIAIGILLALASLPGLSLTVITIFDKSAPKEDQTIMALIFGLAPLTLSVIAFCFVRRLPDKSPVVSRTRRRVLLQGFACNGCGGVEFARQDSSIFAALKGRMRIRCVGCGKKHFASPQLWVLLPPARLDDRFLDADDENALVGQLPLSPIQILICIAGLLVGLIPAVLYMVFVNRHDGANTWIFWPGLAASYLMMWLPIRTAWRLSLRFSPQWKVEAESTNGEGESDSQARRQD